MDSTPSSLSSRRRTFDLPKATPDAGLAEWTSKIKAIQQEVDRDEEAEQRRLQDEIERSRLDRAKRRSALAGYGVSPNRVELPAEGPSKSSNDPDDFRSETFSKLTSSSSSPSPKASPGLPREDMSLAAFIGGRATGPKLNKPATQVDPYDSNLYDQAKRGGPHPIFGQPNTLRQTPSNPKLREPSVAASSQENKQQTSQPVVPPVINVNERVPSAKTPSPPTEASKPLVQPPPKPPIPKKPSGDYLSFSKPQRDNTPAQPESKAVKPVPAVVEPPKKITEISDAAPPTTLLKPVSLAQMVGGRADGPKLTKAPVIERTDAEVRSQARALPGMDTENTPRKTSLPSTTPVTPPKPLAHRAVTLEASPSTRLTSASPPSRPSSAPIVTPSLARPLQPKAQTPPSIIPSTSSKPSPAFLRATPSTQELHPSLTRLQARGIVEQRVRAVSQLRNVPESNEGSTVPIPLPTNKRPTVLDRWQPTASESGPTHSPPVSSSSTASKQNQGLYRQLPGMASGSGLTRLSANQTSQTQDTVAAPVRLPGMASSIPPMDQKEKERPTTLDLTAKEATPSTSSTSHGMSTAPLSHPTRDRARKPRKAGTNKQTSEEQMQPTSIQTPAAPPVNVHVAKSVVVEDVQTLQQPNPTISTTSDSALEKIQALKNELSYPIAKPEALAFPSVETKPQPPVVEGKYGGLGGFNRPTPSNIQVPSIAAPRPMTPSSPTNPDGSPVTPRPRIPSTGARATVMDVAQALLEHEKHIREASFTPEVETETPPVEEEQEAEEEVEELAPPLDVKSIVAGWGRNNVGQQPSLEKRRSTYESRYSVATLPPLVEVKTPAETPQASLSRGFAQLERPPPTVQQLHTALNEWSSNPGSIKEEPTTAGVGDGGAGGPPQRESLPTHDIQIGSIEDNLAPPSQSELIQNGAQPESMRSDIPAQQEAREEAVALPKAAKDDIVHLNLKDGIPPAFNLQALLKETPFIPDLKSQTISVDILVISGYSTTAIAEEPNVFYDAEVVCIIHRSKDGNNDLVSNRVWIWRGQGAIFSEKEERKALELAERYGTTAMHCRHGSEPPHLIHTLGGVLAVRQGLRAHWSAENTSMHRVLRIGDSIFVDEIDLGIWNLCSAYSFCLCILGNIYIWHGRGSTEDERKVASTYAQSLTKTPSSIIELEEGAEDEMFWMILGNEGYANADHWQFKTQLDRLGSRIYLIKSSQRKAPVQVLPSPSALELHDGNVFVVDCRFEVFVVVPAAARGKRTDIQLGIFLAQNVSAATAHKRPFNPPIHVVVLPSKLPLELRAAIRLCDESKLNGGSVPDHMNLLHLGDALEHMRRHSWMRTQLSDVSFLPLGIEPAMLET